MDNASTCLQLAPTHPPVVVRLDLHPPPPYFIAIACKTPVGTHIRLKTVILRLRSNRRISLFSRRSRPRQHGKIAENTVCARKDAKCVVQCASNLCSHRKIRPRRRSCHPERKRRISGLPSTEDARTPNGGILTYRALTGASLRMT